VPNILGVRKANEIVDHDVTDLGTEEERSSARLVILIHGYQTSEERAQHVYAQFADNLRMATRDGARGSGSVWEFHWPGDHPLPPISAATFNSKIGNARLSGELLARRWLRSRDPEQRVVLVAHSLGCRVALEAVKWILDEGQDFKGARIEAVFLLAAAVPVPLCESNETFSAGIAGSLEHVFFSRSDRVLQVAFGPGSYLAGEGGPAVGRGGDPLKRWHGRHDTGLGHGDYWSSDEVARRVAKVLGVHASQDIPSRPLPTWEPFVRRPSRVRRLARRLLGERRPA
jgi:pimeloyl-ACP methyl ester carboxylesterase